MPSRRILFARRVAARGAASVLGSVLLAGTCWAQGANSAGAVTGSPDPAAVEAQQRESAEALVARREAATGRRFDPAYRHRLVGAVAAQAPERLQELLSAGDETSPLLSALGDSSADLVYTPVTPCRVFDTRFSAAGVLAAGTQQNFLVAGSTGFPAQGGTNGGCGVPLGTATSVILNFAAVTPAGAGNLRAWAVASPQPAAPLAAVMNFSPALAALANGVAVPICDPAATSCAAGDLRLQADASSVHVVGDVVGYFAKVDRSQVAAVKAAAVPVLCPTNPLTTTEADLSTVTATFPTAGSVVVTAQAAFNANTTGQYLACTIYRDASVVFSWDAWEPGDSDGFYDQTESRQVTTTVTPGAHTFRVACRTSSGTAGCAFPQIAVQFFGGGELP